MVVVVSRRTVTSSLDFWTVHVFKLMIGKTEIKTKCVRHVGLLVFNIALSVEGVA